MNKRVLFVFYVPSGGMETVNRQRCRALRRHGIQAECLYYRWGAGLQNEADFPIYVTNNDDEIHRLLQANRYDCIVVTTDYPSLPRFRRLGYQGKLVLEIQGFGSVATAQKELCAAVPIVHDHAAALMNPKTPHITAIFQQLYPAIPQFYINNCFDADAFAYQSSRDPENPTVAWVGRIEDNKNWREFLYIAHSLLFYDRRIQIWMFEDHYLSDLVERRMFESLVDQLQLGPYLQIRSNVPNREMMFYYSRIGDSGGFLCNTSKVEGAPLSILEAMSCRCPVLASSSDGVISCISHNETGKSYSLGDIGQAVREGRELMLNEPLRSRIRNRALQLVKSEFHPDKYCREFMNMLQTI
ncbi:glycosyltransferase family 4 protein [Paenibacillus sp. TH7-28]